VNEAALEGFTITGGEASDERFHGGGIQVEWGSPTIRHNIIIHNQAPIGGGVYMWNGAPSVTNNVVAWNSDDGVVCSACPGEVRYNRSTRTAIRGARRSGRW